jgi:hypothetical protein
MSERNYEIRVNGLLPTERLVDELRAVEIAEHEMRTVLSGHFVDQAALYGFLNLLRSYGIEVVEVRRVEVSETDEDQGEQAGGAEHEPRRRDDEPREQ